MKITGHRGFRGLYPESTLAGYRASLELGVDAVDADVIMTKDRVLVVQHSQTLDPVLTRDEEGRWIDAPIPVCELTYAELQRYQIGRIHPKTAYAAFFPAQQPMDGCKIPTLKEVVQCVREFGNENTEFQLEIKTEPDHPELGYAPVELATALARLIQEEGIASRTWVQAFDWSCLLELHRINPLIATAFLTDTSRSETMRSDDPVIAGKWTAGHQLGDYGNSTALMIRKLGGKRWDIQDVQLTRPVLHEARALGLEIGVWSTPSTSGLDINLPLTEAMMVMEVDNITTDRPDEVIRLVSRK